jgi:hypothetical protein
MEATGSSKRWSPTAELFPEDHGLCKHEEWQRTRLGGVRELCFSIKRDTYLSST